MIAADQYLWQVDLLWFATGRSPKHVYDNPFDESRRCQVSRSGPPMISRAIAPTVTECGRPRRRHDQSRARPPTEMVVTAEVNAEDRSTRPS